MKPLFVSLKEDQCVVHWKKLSVFAAAVIVLTAAVAEGCWWLLSNTLSLGALTVGFVLGSFVVVRVVVRAISYQKQEIPETAETTCRAVDTRRRNRQRPADAPLQAGAGRSLKRNTRGKSVTPGSPAASQPARRR